MTSRLPRSALPWLLLAAFTALLVAVSWQRWGNPVSDPGLDVVVAAGWLDGTEPYRDTRYFYGPLGIGALAAAFALLGTSLSAAFAFGLLQAAVIAELWRRLAARWLPPVAVAAGLAVVLAIGFSGSLFNFQLPHTAGATTGLAAVLGVLLAITHGRYGWAGVALGLAALTRPEFLAFAVAAFGGAALGLWRERGWRPAAVALLWAVPGAVVVGGGVLAYFAARAGAEVLFTENLVPVDFVRTVGGSFEAAWHPYDLPSLGALMLRGVAVAGGALALLRAVEAWGLAASAGVPRGRVLRATTGPLMAYAALLGVAVLVATLLGALGGDAAGPVKQLVEDVARLLFPMTALPAVAFAVLGVAVVRWWQRDVSPLGGLAGGAGARVSDWAADLALLAVAAACTLRAYAMFSTDVYATYYAPPAVLVAVIVLWRAAARLGSRQAVVAGSIVATSAVVLAAHAYVGRYSDQTFTVRAPGGTYRADAAAGPNIQRVVDLLAPQVKPGEPMLVLPQEPGFHFLLDTTPALYNATFLPGTLASAQDDYDAAVRFLEVRPPFVIEAARRMDAWGFKESGVDFNQQLVTAVRTHYCVVARFGDTANPPASDLPATAFTVYRPRAALSQWTVSAPLAGETPPAAPAPTDC